MICIVSCGNCICQILVALHSYLGRNTYSPYVDKLINLLPSPFFALSTRINAFFYNIFTTPNETRHKRARISLRKDTFVSAAP